MPRSAHIRLAHKALAIVLSFCLSLPALAMSDCTMMDDGGKTSPAVVETEAGNGCHDSPDPEPDPGCQQCPDSCHGLSAAVLTRFAAPQWTPVFTDVSTLNTRDTAPGHYLNLFKPPALS